MTLTCRLKSVWLPAIPFINYPQFEQACRGVEGFGPIPYALLAMLVAHSASYSLTLRPLHKPLWSQVLNALDAEFRQPRLRTIQLTLSIILSRPGVNFGQGDISLSRVSSGHTHPLITGNRCCSRPRSSLGPFAMVTTQMGKVASNTAVLVAHVSRPDTRVAFGQTEPSAQ